MNKPIREKAELVRSELTKALWELARELMDHGYRPQDLRIHHEHHPAKEILWVAPIDGARARLNVEGEQENAKKSAGEFIGATGA